MFVSSDNITLLILRANFNMFVVYAYTDATINSENTQNVHAQSENMSSN